MLWKIAEIIHEADVADDRFDAPEAPGLDVILRGLSMTGTDNDTPWPSPDRSSTASTNTTTADCWAVNAPAPEHGSLR